MIFGAVMAIIIIAAFFLIKFFIILTHELGHAFAHLLFDRTCKVNIYVGTYNAKDRLWNFSIGRLTVNIKPVLLELGKGYCSSDQPLPTFFAQVVMLLSGSIFTLIICFALFIITLNFDLHGSLKLLTFASLLTSVYVLWYNLNPSTIQIDDKILHTDGRLLIMAFAHRSNFKLYNTTKSHIAANEHQEAIRGLNKLIDSNPNPQNDILKALADQYTAIKDYERSLETYEKIDIDSITDSNELTHIGFLQSVNKKHEAAIYSYSKALEQNAFNVAALVNISIEYIEQGKYDEAEIKLDTAIKAAPDDAAVYAITAYLKIMRNELDNGKQLVDKSLAMDNTYGYAYKVLSIYYSKMNDHFNADQHLAKAKSINSFIS